MTENTGRQRITVKVPASFDPKRHADTLIKQIAEQAGGDGWALDTFDPEKNEATASRAVSVTQVRASSATSMSVSLPKEAKPSDGERIGKRLADQYPGYYMTAFEPHLGKATLTKMSAKEVRCRKAIADAVGAKEWEVTVKANADGGFSFGLSTYTPSKHFDKLTEVATSVVGEDGWYVKVDANALVGQIVPSEPPTFPAVLPTPMERLGHGSLDISPFGRVLPDPGVELGEEIVIDWTASPWTLLGGTPGSGKSVAINAIIADARSNGSELVIVDDRAKKVDFLWCKDFCRPGGWGANNLEQSVAALGLVYDEGQKRAEVLERSGFVNWLDMPLKERFTPILVIVDEMSALSVARPVPKGVPKDSPLMMEIDAENFAKAMISNYINKIIAELRFVGIRMVLSTQATNANTGVPPALRTKMGNFLLQGTAPSRAARGQIFTDETAVPTVPGNVQAGGKRAKGVGVAQLEGQPSRVYKSLYASTDDYRARLLELGVQSTSNPEPTASQVDKYLPSFEDESEAPAPKKSGRQVQTADWELDPVTGERLTGFERANAARHAAANPGKPTRAQKKADAEGATYAVDESTRQAPTCPTCQVGFINPTTGVCVHCGAHS